MNFDTFCKLYTFETIYRISRLLLRRHRIMQLCKLYDKVVKTSRPEKNYYYNCPKRHKSRENDMIYWHLLRQWIRLYCAIIHPSKQKLIWHILKFVAKIIQARREQIRMCTAVTCSSILYEYLRKISKNWGNFAIKTSKTCKNYNLTTEKWALQLLVLSWCPNRSV